MLLPLETSTDDSRLTSVTKWLHIFLVRDLAVDILGLSSSLTPDPKSLIGGQWNTFILQTKWIFVVVFKF